MKINITSDATEGNKFAKHKEIFTKEQFLSLCMLVDIS